MKKKYVFRIPGNPVRVFKSETEGRQPLNTYMENKLRYMVSLENQHEEAPIKEPVEATFKFYMPKSCKYKPARVSIVELFRFANQMSRGLIYKKDCLLYNVKLEKIYSDDPHVEIEIVPAEGATEPYENRKKRKTKK